MPELPEVETVRRGLVPVMEGRRVVRLVQNRPDLRFPLPERFGERVGGAVIERLGRRAKFLVAELSTGEALVMHLGMSGRFTIHAASGRETLDVFVHETGADPKHDHVVFEMEDGARIVFNDPRRFGFMEIWPLDAFEAYPRLKGLGPEPLSNTFSAAYLSEALAGKATPVKAALLDQSIIAGLGNIYVCEALFRSGISPRRLARTIPGLRAERLAPAINAVISEAIDAGGSTLRDFAGPDGALGYFPHSFTVYGRDGEPCPTCQAPVRRIVQSGRSSFYCGHCQR